MDSKSKAFVDLWALLRLKDSQLFQRFKSRRLKEGDDNSGFFHDSIKSRSKRNSFLALKVDDNWVEGEAGTLLEVFNIFFWKV